MTPDDVYSVAWTHFNYAVQEAYVEGEITEDKMEALLDQGEGCSSVDCLVDLMERNGLTDRDVESSDGWL